MTPRIWLRAAGAAALAGGLLRIASPLAARLAPPGPQVCYLVIDILLTLGLVGVYVRWASALGRLGLVAFAVALSGVLVVRSQGAVPGAYMLGATMLAIGMAAIGAGLLFVRRGPRLAPGLWLAVLSVGLAGPPGQVAAGVLFGLGFVAAGAGLLKPPA